MAAVRAVPRSERPLSKGPDITNGRPGKPPSSCSIRRPYRAMDGAGSSRWCSTRGPAGIGGAIRILPTRRATGCRSRPSRRWSRRLGGIRESSDLFNRPMSACLVVSPTCRAAVPGIGHRRFPNRFLEVLSMKVLLVEDDPELAEGVTRFLRGQGDELVQIADGMQADQLLQSERFDFALVDVGPPGLGGYEIVRRIRNRGQTLPVIIITARDALDDRIYGLDVGADDYLAKPFQFAELTARMRAVLRRADAASQDRSFLRAAYTRSGGPSRLAEPPTHGADRARMGPARRAGECGWQDGAKEGSRRMRPGMPWKSTCPGCGRSRSPAGLQIRTVRGFGYRLESNVSDDAMQPLASSASCWGVRIPTLVATLFGGWLAYSVAGLVRAASAGDQSLRSTLAKG